MARSWERHDLESAQAYSHFVVYRDMGPRRSIRSMPANMSRRQLEKFSSRWSWKARAQDWDSHIARRADQVLSRELAADRVKSAQRRFKGGQLASSSALRALERLGQLDIATMDASKLLATLAATRTAFELLGLACLDAEDQRRSYVRQKRSEPLGITPEELFEGAN